MSTAFHLPVASLSSLWQRALHTLRSLALIPDPEPVDYPFAASDVAQMHRLCSDPDAAAIDDASWKDLMLDQYRESLSQEVSIFGQHALYQRLRAGGGAVHRDNVAALLADPARAQQLRRDCKSLRHADTEIATLLFEDAAPPVPWWAARTWPLPFLLIASIGAVVWSPMAWLATGFILYLLISTQMRYHERVEAWQRAMGSLHMLLRVVRLLGGADAAAAGKLNQQLTRSPLVNLTPGLRGYLDWFALANLNHYFKGVRLVQARLDFLRDCFTRVANLEADVALARHLHEVPAFCWVTKGEAGKLTLTDTVHPLLPHAQALSVDLAGKGAFISGQNGIGKSTLLRTVGLNLVAARAFGFCYARQALVPDLPVYTSMQSEDSMLGGESLYMAELRRAQELLAAANGPHPGICIIDEIFRGTNHLESVSAAAAVLDVLAAQGLVIVSSHNLVLGSLLAQRLTPLCVARTELGELSLTPGVLAHTNGIALLGQRGFGSAVEARAGKVFDWLSGYLAHPGDCSGVLASAAVAAPMP